MEKEIGKNVSSGAKKVERVAEEKTNAASVNEQTAPKKKTQPRKAKAAKSAKTSSKKPASAKAAKQSKPVAKKAKEVKSRAQKKEEKLMKRAQLKEKKIEKKAALKQKKLERKELIAKKRAERKQAKIEKKAALKNKKLERRAEKIARREMLKSETKAEKQKRLAREKKDRIALKRQKQEAAERARAQKHEAREKAHERKAQNKRHKREQKTARKQNRRGFGGWLAAVISLGVACLALATVVTAGSIQMNDMNVSSENVARETLYEMVSVSEDLDNNLAKLRVSSGKNEQQKLLTDIVVDSMLMENALERIPVDAATSTDISSFVNRTGSYARTLLSKIASGKTLSETEKNTVAYLSEVNAKIYNELNTLVTHMTKSQLREFLKGERGEVSDMFGQVGKDTKAQSEEILDAPFSGEGNVNENKLAALEEITEDRAEELAREYFSGYHIREVRYTGETASKEMACYNFVLTDENDLEIYAQITRNGGKLAFFDTYEECKEKNFDLDTCDSLAKEFLAGLGIKNVEAVWLSDGGMVADITYVSVDGGVRAYPDMIRVRVCESKGRVVGMEARGYLLNSTDRNLEAGISEREARARLSDGLQAEHGTLALVPVDGREVLAYEFFCRSGETEYVVYLDANTGDEVQMFRVRQSANGSYLR